MSTNPYEASQEKSEGPAASRTVSYAVIGLTAVVGLLFVGAFLFVISIPISRNAYHREASLTSCEERMQQIALALQMYHDQYKAFPPAYTVDDQGKRLHSWRTLILPFLTESDGKKIYEQIDFTKPWDDPKNAVAFASVPYFYIYECDSVSRGAIRNDLTTYLASVGPDAAMHPTEPRKKSDIKDDILSTLMVIEVPVDKAVPWMSPQDADDALILSIRPGPEVGHNFKGITVAIFADGTLKHLSTRLPPEKRRAMISIDGGEKVKLD